LYNWEVIASTDDNLLLTYCQLTNMHLCMCSDLMGKQQCATHYKHHRDSTRVTHRSLITNYFARKSILHATLFYVQPVGLDF